MEWLCIVRNGNYNEEVMIYQKYNFVDTFSNASAIGSSRGRLVVAELGKLIAEQPKEVALALSDAGIRVPKSPTKQQLIKLVLNNSNNSSMITNLSLMIFASASIDMGYNFFGKNRETSGDKAGMFQKLGSWFKERKERRATRKAGRESKDNTSLWQKVGGFVKDNKDEISLVGGSLADALSNRRASATSLSSNSGSGSIAQDILRNDNQQKAGFFAKNQTAIIVGGVLIGVAFIYWKTRQK